MTPRWTVRACRPGDEFELVRLFERAFGRAITVEHWRWKLKQLPSPVENVWLAVHQDQPICQYAGIPVQYRLLDREVTAIVGADVMTAPEFQRQGVMSQVGRRCLEAWRSGGIPFTIGVPNQRWIKARAVGWQELFPFQWMVRPLRPEAVLARRLKAPILSDLKLLGSVGARFWNRRLVADPALRIRAVSWAGPEFDRLWQTCQFDSKVSIVRDSAWVNWRYLSSPLFKYQVLLAERDAQPVGYVAYRVAESQGVRVGSICELVTGQMDTKARAALLRHVLDRLYAARAELAVTLAIPRTPVWHDFRRAGFFPRAAFSVQIVPFDSGLPLDILRDPANWSLWGGDFDVI